MKRIIALFLAGALLALAGCNGGDGTVSTPEPTSSAASDAGSDATPVDLQPFSGFDPAAGLSDEELAATVKAAYEGTGEFAPDKLPTAEIETTMGNIKIRLFPQFAPKAVENFITHAKKGYYENVKFHRVIKDFMIQGGDPKGDGTGGESIWVQPFEDELNDILHNFRGAISMANSGSNTNGSQFFIVQNNKPMTEEEWTAMVPTIYQQRQLYEAYARLLPMTAGKNQEEIDMDSLQKAMDSLNAELKAKEEAGVPEEYVKRLAPVGDIYEQVGGTAFLDNKHTVFGYVYEGMDVVDAIASVETVDPGTKDAPKDNVLIRKITITEPAGTSSGTAAALTSSEAAPSEAATPEAAPTASEAAPSQAASAVPETASSEAAPAASETASSETAPAASEDASSGAA